MQTNRKTQVIARTLILAAILVVPSISICQGDMFGGFDAPPAWSSFKLNKKTTMDLKFRNANVDMVLGLFSKTSGITIIKDPALVGPITVTSGKPVSLDDAFKILSTVLDLQGFAFHKDGQLLVIKKKSQTNQGGRSTSFDPTLLTQMMDRSKPDLKVYYIKYANASQVARVVNEVFANSGGGMDQMLQQLMGGGGAPVRIGGASFEGDGAATAAEPQGRGGFGGGAGGFGGGGGQGRGGGGFQFGGNQGRGGANGNPMSNFFQNMFGGRNQNTSVVKASSDDFSNSVIVNAPKAEQAQVKDLINQLDKQSDAPMQTKVFKLDYASSADVAPMVQNVLTANAPRGKGGIGTQNVPFEQRIQQAARFGSTQAAFGTVVSEPRTNSIIVTATDENLKTVADVIKEVDKEVTYENSAVVIPLSNAQASQIAPLLNQAFGNRNNGGNQNTGQNRGNQQNRNTNQQQNRPNNGTGGGGGAAIGGGGATRVSDDAYAVDENNLSASMQIDLEDPTATSGDLATAVTVGQGFLFGGGGQNNNAANRQNQQPARDAQGRLINIRDLQGQVSIIPDPATNSVIVVTSPGNLELVQGIIDKLDKIPQQVMIETIIVEATLGSADKLGVEWNYTMGKAFGTPGQTATGSSAFGQQTNQDPIQGFRFTLAGSALTSFMKALTTDTKFEVLSTPRIYTSNNVQAEINISQRVPYVISQREDAQGNLTFNYAFQDVGIVLTVTPRITSKGEVTMDVTQTANDLQGFTSFNAPIINQRLAQTTVTVGDGETIILGGIIRNEVKATTNKIPILGDIPILGNLFKSTDKSKTKTELMVLLTPRIVRNDEDARKLRDEQMKKMSPQSQGNINKVTPPPIKKDGKKVPPPKKDDGSGGN